MKTSHKPTGRPAHRTAAHRTTDHRADHRADQHWQAGVRLLKSKLWSEAATEFDRGAHLKPDDGLMWLNLARARLAAKQWQAATLAAEQASRLQPDSPLACRMLAECLGHQHRHAEALAVFERYPAHAPRDFDWFNAHGNLLFLCKRLQDAVSAFFQALAIRVDAALVHYRLGLCFKDLGMTLESTECFRTATVLDSGAVRALALSLLVHEGRQTCDWSREAEDTAALLQSLEDADGANGQLLSPFALLAVDATPAQQRRIGEIRTRGLSRGAQPLPPAGPAPARPDPPGLSVVRLPSARHLSVDGRAAGTARPPAL